MLCFNQNRGSSLPAQGCHNDVSRSPLRSSNRGRGLQMPVSNAGRWILLIRPACTGLVATSIIAQKQEDARILRSV